jgi:hypothetical protein
MPISVDKDLSAAPNPTTLPKRVEFRQTLHSTLASEDISVAYSLDPGHNVWFEDSDDKLQKVIVRQETVGMAPQVCVDRLAMALGPGNVGPPLTVEVNQAIRDSQGNVTPSLCVIRIQS